MDTSKNQKPVYQMTTAQKEEVNSFLILAKRCLDQVKREIFGEPFDQDKWERFKRFLDHLCLIQNPSSWKHLSHGIAMARTILFSGEYVDEKTLLAIIGHDWERAYGEKRIVSSDYPNTEKDFGHYMKARAVNSSILFGAEMEKFYSTDIVEIARHYIMRHNDLRETDIPFIRHLKGMAFLSPLSTNYYRNQRIYMDAEKKPFPSLEMEEARRKGFEVKVKFILKNCEQSISSLRVFVGNHFCLYAVNVINELMDIMKI